jgi:hypothetical protein
MKFYICERHNPQLGIYYIPCGQMSVRKAKDREKSLYGSNFMHGFETEKAYKAELARLEKWGNKIQL